MKQGQFADIGATYTPPQKYKENTRTPIRNLTASLTGTGNGVDSPASFNSLPALIRPGDTVWMHPGAYPFTQQLDYNTIANATDPIVIQPMIEGTVSIDGTTVTPGTDYQMKITGEFLEFNGLEVRNMPSKGYMIVGNHNTIRAGLVHHCNGSGVHVMNPADNNVQTGQSYNLITDTLIHNCSDANLSSQGENADGIAVSIGDGNQLIRNITHTNSDDGIDVWQSNDTIVDSCLSYLNGYGVNGDGNGMKMGNINSRGNKIYNSIACFNKSRGFDANGSIDSEFYFCTSFGQKIAYNMTATNIVANCIGDTPSQVILGIHDNNSWQHAGIPWFITQIIGEAGFAEQTFEPMRRLLTYRFNDYAGTASNPSNRYLRFNNVAIASATNIYITNKNVWMEDTLAAVNTLKAGQKVVLTTNSNSIAIFLLSADATGTGYSTLVGTMIHSRGNFIHDEIVHVSVL